MEITYRQEGEYQLPSLAAPEAPMVGKYGILRRSYLREHRSGLYTGMLLSGKLTAHLQQIDREAEELLFRLVNQTAEKVGVTEQLKTEDQMKWVGMMNNIRAAAEEAVLRELVYT